MTDLPDPMTEPETNLRDFPFMPLDVVRLRDSTLTIKATGDEFRAAVLLWCASWHQIPAASLPGDDAELASLCGYGRARAEWRKVRDGAMRGWVLCADHRWYHPVIAEKAREAWERKQRQRDRSRKGNAARWGSSASADALAILDGEDRASFKDSHKDSRKDSNRDARNHPKGQGQG